MRHKKTTNRHLPPRMKVRERTYKSGKVWKGYYYDGRDEFGNRREIPLGTDLNQARIKWAELEKKEPPKQAEKTLGWLFDYYKAKAMSHLSKRTKDDYESYWRQLKKVFEEAPIDQVTIKDIAKYKEIRSLQAPVRANRELAFLSILFNYAIEKEYTTLNPASHVKKNKETGRDYYAYDDVFFAVYKLADQATQDMMMISYFTGQRPADVHKIRLNQISDSHLLVGQNKRGRKLRIKLSNENGRTGLGMLIDDILARREQSSPYLLAVRGDMITGSTRRYRFNRARALAIKEALAKNDHEMAKLIENFQFRDIRPKAASDLDDISLASKLLGHTKEHITRMVYIRKGQEVTPLEPKSS